MKKEELIYYAFSTAYGLSRRTKRRLLQTFSEEEILGLEEKELRHFLNEKELSAWKKFGLHFKNCINIYLICIRK